MHESTAYLTATPVDGRRLRLFCFHHAGAGASVFTRWRDALGPGVDTLPVQLPARERRIADPLPATLTDLIADLDDQLAPFLRAPYAFYGHSMGAIVAYHLTRHIVARSGPAPARLVVAACAPPGRHAALRSAPDRSDRELTELLLRIGGLSESLVRYPAWHRAALCLVRRDLRLCAQNVPEDGQPLTVPIHVFTGRSDPLITREDADAWADRTTGRTTVHEVSGGHLFLVGDSAVPLLTQLAAVLSTAVAEEPR
ncbi:alpha/beta fold hydrolase [Micromonospora rifamycinica]|uniref:thioesterase II family protein n=1 Tax=Micromonospora rifamycinica TaxID=291594 RepID=UPI00343EFA19